MNDQDERGAFEAYMFSTGMVWDNSREDDGDGDEQYADVETRFNWGVWQAARAASTSANVAQCATCGMAVDPKCGCSLGRATSANVAQGAEAVCRTCNGHGMIGGPSYYAPDEGGEPCPDCAPPAQTALTDDARDAIRRAALEEACAAIKAEDDRQSSDDYMLDSDDCIAVIRDLTAAQSASGDTKSAQTAKE